MLYKVILEGQTSGRPFLQVFEILAPSAEGAMNLAKSALKEQGDDFVDLVETELLSPGAPGEGVQAANGRIFFGDEE